VSIRFVSVAALVLAAFAPPTPAAATNTGNDLKRYCESEGFQKGVCAGFIVGVSHTGTAFRTKVFCIPEGVENGQLLAIVQRFMSDSPQSLHEPGVVIVAKAFAGAFPCPR
jgi:hypothetical protein